MIMLVSSCKPKVVEQPAPVKTDISEFLGQWTLDIKGGSVGWLEVRQEDNYLDADLLWGGGSVSPVANVFLSADKFLTVDLPGRDIVRKKGEDNSPIRTQSITEWLEVTKISADTISGYRLNPRRNGIGVDSTFFRGIKFPPVPPAPDLKSLKFGEPVSLFNGKDLTGWKLINDKQKNGFSVVDGTLVNDPVQVEGQPHVSYGNLRTEQEFMDFNLKLEVNIPEKNNSGVYLRGMYEIQVLDSYKKPLDPHNMGALYSRIKPSVGAEKPAGQWQTLDITLCDRHVTVVLNGITIIDNQPAYGPTGGAILWDVYAPGPIYLQGDHGKVSYRNIVLTPIVK
jgi:hypothetical protein